MEWLGLLMEFGCFTLGLHVHVAELFRFYEKIRKANSRYAYKPGWSHHSDIHYLLRHNNTHHFK